MNRGNVALIALILGGLWLWSKRKPVEAKVVTPEEAKPLKVAAVQLQQITEAVEAGAQVLATPTGEPVGWVEQTPQGAIPVLPWGATPGQEQAAIEAFERSLTIVSPVTLSSETYLVGSCLVTRNYHADGTVTYARSPWAGATGAVCYGGET